MSESVETTTIQQAAQVAEAKKTMDSKVFQELTANVSAACTAELRGFVSDLSKLKNATLARMWTFGRRVENLRREEMKRPKVGTEPVKPLEILTQLTGYTEGYLNKMSRLFTAFPTAEKFEELSRLRLSGTDQPLTWPHMEQLLKFFNQTQARDKFDEMIKKTCENGWTPDELEQLIKQANERAAKPPRGGGRPINVPATFSGRASRAIKQLEVFQRNAEAIYCDPAHNFETAVRSIPAEELPKSREEVEAYAKKLRQLAQQVTQAVQSMNKDLAKVEKYLEATASSETDTKAPDAKTAEVKLKEVKETKKPTAPDPVPLDDLLGEPVLAGGKSEADEIDDADLM